jgi:transcriptional/translational regulatory protein YebC/TACO1
MAGHSHWAGIKHKKAVVDSKRGKLWSRLSKSIIVAAKLEEGTQNEIFDRGKLSMMLSRSVCQRRI